MIIQNPKYKTQNTKFGFTLIELLVVISILGILAGLVISNVQGVRERARDSQRKNDLGQIKDALRIYKNDYGIYPAASSGQIVGCGTVATPTACSWGSEFTRGSTTYMKELPQDPSSTPTTPLVYTYENPDPDSFTLYALLENESDSDIGKSQARCGITGQGLTTRYYVCSD